MKKPTNLGEFKNTLPYASEIFGVYQPLIGWKSKRVQDRVDKGLQADKWAVMNAIFGRYRGDFQIHVGDNLEFERISGINVAVIEETPRELGATILNEIRKTLPAEKEMNGDQWKTYINADSLNRVLNTVKDINRTGPRRLPGRHAWLRAIKSRRAGSSLKTCQKDPRPGALLDLVKNGQFDYLKQIFYRPKYNSRVLLAKLRYKDPFDYIDPRKELDRVGLSPIGIVHLFRQYFYEFDTFLGTPVGHIWLSPGSNVELIEISTRKTTTEKTLELQTENMVKSELALTEQDEISDAVKEENRNETKFGASVSASENWIWGSANQSASFDMNTTQQTAREQTHKHMRQQSEKLSTEIRKNYKSTFKTVTEVTDTTSKRYSLSNYR